VHWTLQPPQLALLVLVSTQPPLHWVWFGGQLETQAPALQT
jgi:hypothetical protein